MTCKCVTHSIPCQLQKSRIVIMLLCQGPILDKIKNLNTSYAYIIIIEFKYRRTA